MEDATDRLAAQPVTRLGPDNLERLGAYLAPITARLGERMIPYPNAIGVPRPEPSE